MRTALQVDITFDQVLALVRQLPTKEKIKLTKELEKEGIETKLSGLLKKDGILIISCPNIRHYTGLFKIFLKGDFTYTKEGLFDRTHFRFFCKKNLKELAESGGLKVTTITPLFKLVEVNKSYIVNLFTLGLLEQFFALQYVIVASKED